MERKSMNVSCCQSSGLLVAAGLCLAAVSFGQTLELFNGGGLDNGATVTIGGESGVLTSPYQMAIPNKSSNLVAMYCDDAVDNVSDGQGWDVTSTTLATITSSATPPVTTVFYGADAGTTTYGTDTVTGGLTQAQKYVAAVDLAVELNNLALNDNTDRDALSVALWDVFDPVAALTTAVATYSPAQTDLTAAITFAESYTTGPIGGYTATIYTPLASSSGYNLNTAAETLTGGIATSGGAGVPQEFISLSPVPEPSTWAVLGFDLVGAGIVGLYFRRRKSRAQS
jgi:hypothetical protein